MDSHHEPPHMQLGHLHDDINEKQKIIGDLKESVTPLILDIQLELELVPSVWSNTCLTVGNII